MSLSKHQSIVLHQSWNGTIKEITGYQVKKNNICVSLEIMDKKLRLCKVGSRRQLVECSLSDIVDIYRPDKNDHNNTSDAIVTIEWKRTNDFNRMVLEFSESVLAQDVVCNVYDVAKTAGADFVSRKHTGVWKKKGILKKSHGEYTCCASQNKNHPGCVKANHLDIAANRASTYSEELVEIRSRCSTTAESDTAKTDLAGAECPGFRHTIDNSAIPECESMNACCEKADSANTSLLHVDGLVGVSRYERKTKTMSLPVLQMQANRRKTFDTASSRCSAYTLFEDGNPVMDQISKPDFQYTRSNETITVQKRQQIQTTVESFTGPHFSSERRQSIVVTSELERKVDGMSRESVVSVTSPRKESSQSSAASDLVTIKSDNEEMARKQLQLYSKETGANLDLIGRLGPLAGVVHGGITINFNFGNSTDTKCHQPSCSSTASLPASASTDSKAWAGSQTISLNVNGNLTTQQNQLSSLPNDHRDENIIIRTDMDNLNDCQC